MPCQPLFECLSRFVVEFTKEVLNQGHVPVFGIAEPTPLAQKESVNEPVVSLQAHGTARATAEESRSSPGLVLSRQ